MTCDLEVYFSYANCSWGISWSPRNSMLVEPRLTQERILNHCGTRLQFNWFRWRFVIQDWKYCQFINSLYVVKSRPAKSGYSLSSHQQSSLSLSFSHPVIALLCHRARATLQVCHMLRRVAAAMLFLVHLGYL